MYAVLSLENEFCMVNLSCNIGYHQTFKTLSEVFLSTLAACSSRRKSPLSDVPTLLFQENVLPAWRRASERGVSFICIQFHGFAFEESVRA